MSFLLQNSHPSSLHHQSYILISMYLAANRLHLGGEYRLWQVAGRLVSPGTHLFPSGSWQRGADGLGELAAYQPVPSSLRPSVPRHGTRETEGEQIIQSGGRNHLCCVARPARRKMVKM